MSYIYILHLLVWSVLHTWVKSAEAQGAVIRSSQIAEEASQTVKTITFASAVQIEANVASLLRPTSAAVFPLPTNIAEFPEYAAVKLLAPAMPPKQQVAEDLDADALVADLVSKTHISGSEDPIAQGNQSDALRVMIVGDSMTQGQEGDWTWRYRIWQWFQEHKIAVRFVGPYKGTQAAAKAAAPSPPPLYGASPPPPSEPDMTGGYAKDVEPEFLSNCNHFSVWGRAAATDKGLIKGVVEKNPADLLLVMLGFNDLGWWYSDAHGLIESIETFVSSAREANPKIKFALANVPHRSFMGGREDLVENTNLYNRLLPPLIKKLTSEQSPIFLVELERHYKCHPEGCPAAYDGLHPNGWGDFQIAHAFSRILTYDFKLGSSPLEVPAHDDKRVIRDLPVPSNFKVFSSPQGVTATWDAVYGAYSYDLQVSINDGGPGFSGSATLANRWDARWPLEGWTYSLSVRARAGEAVTTDYTETLSAVAKPELAPAPDNIEAEVTENGLVIKWDPPTGPYTDSIVEYNILYWEHEPKGPAWMSSAAFTESPGVIPDLEPDKLYRFAVLTWNKNGEGLPRHVDKSFPGKLKPKAKGADSSPGAVGGGGDSTQKVLSNQEEK